MRNIGYSILVADSAFLLSEKVVEYIEKGWNPVGGVGLASNTDTWYQAMVKDYDDEKATVDTRTFCCSAPNSKR